MLEDTAVLFIFDGTDLVHKAHTQEERRSKVPEKVQACIAKAVRIGQEIRATDAPARVRRLSRDHREQLHKAARGTFAYGDDDKKRVFRCVAPLVHTMWPRRVEAVMLPGLEADNAFAEVTSHPTCLLATTDADAVVAADDVDDEILEVEEDVARAGA